MYTAVPVRTVCCYANNKPWITSEVKMVLKSKKRAFKNGNSEELRRLQKELKTCLRAAKESYRRRLEGKLRENNTREVWEGMKIITGCKKVEAGNAVGSIERAN